MTTRVVPRDGLVAVEANRYPVPLGWAGRQVRVHLLAEEVLLGVDGEAALARRGRLRPPLARRHPPHHRRGLRRRRAAAPATPRYFPLFWDFQGSEEAEDLHQGFRDALLDADDHLEALGIAVAVVDHEDLFTAMGRLRRELRARDLALLLLGDQVEELVTTCSRPSRGTSCRRSRNRSRTSSSAAWPRTAPSASRRRRAPRRARGAAIDSDGSGCPQLEPRRGACYHRSSLRALDGLGQSSLSVFQRDGRHRPREAGRGPRGGRWPPGH